MMTRTALHFRRLLPWLAVAGFGLVLAGMLLLTYRPAAAQAGETDPTFHPAFLLRDADGANVLASGAPVSPMRTCGECHDTIFIAEHSGHADAGFSAQVEAGSIPGGRAWETSAGWYGGWDPFLYSALAPAGDLTREAWIASYGAYHVGGGPAAPDVEMNCFLCHTQSPDNDARIAALRAGDFAWASTATLSGMGIASMGADGWTYAADAFNDDGTVRESIIRVQDPSDANCGQCHGQVYPDAREPMTLAVGDPDQRTTYYTGQVFSPQRLSNSGANLENKSALGRSWDVHAERVVGCTDCHYALNNPVFYTEATITRPDHLQFDPRRMDFGEYLYRPLHQFANAGAETITEFGSSARTCADCHDASSTHTWLPYADRHFSAVSCETCHVPALYAPAVESIDWTALHSDGSALVSYRGVESAESAALVTGYQPALLPVETADGVRLAPHNLVSAWYWVAGEPGQPVPLADLRAAWLAGDSYAPEIVAAFDADGDGSLSDAELRLDSEAKVALIAERLAARGLDNPRIAGDIEPHAIHHSVTHGVWATRECRTCHGEESRLNTPLQLTGYVPGGTEPTLIAGDAHLNGSLMRTDDGALYYRPASQIPPVNLYVFGHDSVAWVDALGLLLFLGVLAGAVLHGGLRFLAARRMAASAAAAPAKRQVYMYSVYERQWHWLQTVAIAGLLFTGLVIHRPNTFSLFSFDWVVPVHNVLAVLLVINAALSAFYHLVSGEIRQYLPRPYGFFDQAFAQAKYYLGGIFRGDPHPIEKTPERKLNPLQQITYLAILNILLPLQIITGALMWGAQHFPQLTERLGGLPFLAPFHTLIAWLFASFIVMHVYLTTTGHTPLANIKAMMLGWDEVEVHDHAPSTQPQTGEGSAS